MAATKSVSGKKAASKSSAAARGTSVLSEAKQPKATGKARGGTSKSVEQIYQKKTQLEHILLRPDSYGKSELMFSNARPLICGVAADSIGRYNTSTESFWMN